MTGIIYKLLGFSFGVLFLYVAGPPFFGRIPVQWSRGLFVMLISVLVFMKFPAAKTSPKDRLGVVDYVMIALAVISIGYWIVYFRAIIMRPGRLTSFELVMASTALIVCLETSRRTLGAVFPMVSVVMMVYAMFGNSEVLPQIIRTPGYSWNYVVAYCYTLDGIFGFILNTIMAFVTLFVIFGGLMSALGAGDFFINMPYALTCGLRGGPAKTAVVASGLFGSISGSATANTAATGAFTIPLMIKTGYPKEVAGAIEPAASTGGMFMPPVMGAGAFIMADLLRIPYVEIVKAAAVPALIYFFSVFMIVHFYAGAKSITPVPPEERPNIRETFLKGAHFLLPLILLIYLLLTYMSPSRAIYWVVLAMVATTLIVRILRRQSDSIVSVSIRLVKDVINGFINSATDCLVIGSVAGSTGVVVSVVMITGLGFSFTTAVMALAGNHLIVGVLMALLASYVLGMGLTVTASYILCAILAANGLVALGMTPLAAHFLLFWYSQTSNISPPVCLAAFVGAGIAKANPFRVGFNALMFSAYIFIMPLLFVYSDILMPDGLTASAVQAMISGFLSTIPYAAFVTGYYRAPLSWPVRLLLLCSSLLMMHPGAITDFVGVSIMILVYAWQFFSEKRNKAAPVR
ncbi:MAG: TRAP transporter fused permease subunit [Methylobacteriaceae bacterium]|nr:TRAP transporter fused permease subunit [Methylobacteriaceae bacterium]